MYTSRVKKIVLPTFNLFSKCYLCSKLMFQWIRDHGLGLQFTLMNMFYRIRLAQCNEFVFLINLGYDFHSVVIIYCHSLYKTQFMYCWESEICVRLYCIYYDACILRVSPHSGPVLHSLYYFPRQKLSSHFLTPISHGKYSFPVSRNILSLGNKFFLQKILFFPNLFMRN